MDDVGEPEVVPVKRRLDYLSTNKKTPFAEIYLTSFLSACNSEFFVYPLDVCKTRMQIQGEVASKSGQAMQRRGMIATAMGIIKEEGIHKLYGGLSAMALRHSVFTGIKMWCYDALREMLITYDKDNKPTFTVLRSSLAGIIAGSVANVVSSPTDLIKIQMQMEGKRRLLGEPPRIHNVYQALTTIYRAGGIPALWKGVVPSTARAALVTVGDVSFYDVSKRQIIDIFNVDDNRLVQLIAAMIAGFAGAALSTPADVVKSRIMNQPIDDKGRGLHYKGMVDCFTKLVNEEGFLAMYKGFIPYWLRVGPWSLIFWMTFEQIRRFRGDEAY